jgi:C_GCAxxG_C_C family probable redox protein
MTEESNVGKALSYFESGFNCSQAILAAFSKDLGLEEVHALKLASGLGGGMGCTARTCGAVTGALLVIGLKSGNSSADDKDSRHQTYSKVREFIGEFESRRGTIECNRLLGVDISQESGVAKAQENNLFKTVCPGIVNDAALILEKMIL